jgi:hypothetical protein
MTLRAMLVAVALSSLVVGGQAKANYINGNNLIDECQLGDDLKIAKGSPNGDFVMGILWVWQMRLMGLHFAWPEGPREWW